MQWLWRGVQESDMLELLLVITFLGLMLASRRRMGVANPFQIYFLIWFLNIFAYYVSRHNYIKISPDVMMALFVIKLLSFLIMFIVYYQQEGATKFVCKLNISKSQYQWIIIALISVIVALPFVYLRAITLAVGENIFTLLGYIKLRSAITNDGESFGLLGYCFTLSFIVSSLIMISYWQGRARICHLVLSAIVSLSYCYLSTGRTFILLFFCLMIVPSVIIGSVEWKGILVSLLVAVGLFIFSAVMTAKGIATEKGFLENITSFFENLSGYTIAPLLAFSELVESGPKLDWGENTFRFFIYLQYAIGIIDTPPMPLIRDYTFVPDPTNVYTVYEVYFRDFAYFGMFIPVFFLIFHYWLYRKAVRFGGVWIFYYSASIYPLLMQFFQDQYLSLLSQWIQVVFWYWFFLRVKIPKMHISELRNA